MVEVKILNGKLNKDSSQYRMPPNDFIDALNITRSNTEVVYNVTGNTIAVDHFLHDTGINKRIGNFEDVTRNRIYKFVWNSEGYHVITYYDAGLDTFVKVLQNLTDTDDIDILEFDPSYRINHIDIIYRDDDGDILMWATGNATPKCLNVKRLIDGDYPIVKKAFIEMSKKPFLSPPTAVYGTDTAKGSNALKRNLFQFAARPVFDDYQKGTFSTYSKIPLPIGYYGSDNDIVTTSNNFITLTVETGDIDVAKIEIAMRNNIGNDWGDFVLVASLDKAQLNIPDNSVYQFLFYNDAIYPPIDITEVLQLFDNIPLLAGAQVLANGNVPVYGDITEGYDNYPVSQLQVTITAANQTNVPPDTNPPAITYTSTNTGSAIDVIFTVTGTIPTGTVYEIYAVISATFPPILLASYTSLAADTNADVRLGLYNSTSPSYQFSFNPNYRVLLPLSSYILYITVVPGASGAYISTEKTWMPRATYIYGIVYVDEQNRDMPGVTTFADPVNSDNDFVVTTPGFSLDGTDVQTPVISASINHLPPAGAVKYHWVRRRQTYGDFMMYVTCDFKSDADYYYFCLANIEAFKTANSQFIYSTAPISDESRLQVIAGVTAGVYNGNIWTEDYQILGTVTKTLTGGFSPADDRLFVKVKKPLSAPSPAYSVNMLVMVYTPALNPSTLADSVYWEWGETYDIYELSGVNYHRGADQDQTSIQPATFTWEEGDVYFHQRPIYQNIVGAAPYTPVDFNLMDANFSDYFNSAVNDNGRAQAIEVNARRQRNPVLVRFGGAFEAGTNINNINRFKFLNYDEYDRSFGIIRKMFIEGRRLFIFQQFDVGVVPILTQIVKDTSGDPLQANSDTLLNKIGYPYAGKHGIGDVPESFAYSDGAKYFVDSNLGMPIRLSQDGMTELSVVYKCNTFFIQQLAAYGKGLDNGIVPAGQVYTGNPTVYGGFDNGNNKYIICMEAIARYTNPTTLDYSQDAVTISFFETRTSMEGFESILSYHPEGVTSLNNLFVSFKDGELWKHNYDYNIFYWVRYDCSITPVFNQNELDKKTFIAVELQASQAWDCPEIITSSNEYVGYQTSNLVTEDFEELEGNFNAALLCATNSIGGLINGSSLKGNLCSIKFKIETPQNLVTLNQIILKSINSPLNVKI